MCEGCPIRVFEEQQLNRENGRKQRTGAHTPLRSLNTNVLKIRHKT